MILRWFWAFLLVSPFACFGATAAVVGSKAFTEGYILGELTAETMAAAGPVQRRLGLGATGIALAALRAGEIDLYPEYTGTIEEALFRRSGGAAITRPPRGAPAPGANGERTPGLRE